MKLLLASVGNRPPKWAAEAFDDYARRLPKPYRPRLIEIPPARRRRNEPLGPAIADEARRLRSAIPADARLVALDAGGEPWRTEEIAEKLRDWSASGDDVAFLVGGADGLAPDLRRDANATWSLGPLTLPHMLVRVIVAEQIYRAWSILENHPYHRA